MPQAVYLVIGAFLFALSVWAFRIIYLESGAGPAAASGGATDTSGADASSGQDSRKSSTALTTAIVLVITVMQLYRVAQDPSRTFSWVVLGIGLIACVLMVSPDWSSPRGKAFL
jgi:uncharacterized membrane protein